MAKNHPSGGRPPPRPWKREGNNNTPGANPFRPPSNTSTADSVEASGTANPGELVSPANRTHPPATMNPLGTPVPTRPRQQQTYGYGSNLGMSYGYGSSYRGGMYVGGGGGMYNRGGMYGGGGGLYGSSGMYGGGGGMYNRGYGMVMRTGVGMSPYGGQDPNDPSNQPPSPPGFWISFLRVLHGAVNFFGRVAMLIDQNTQAFHMLMSALLQLCDRGGMLYGELARFVLRLLGVKTKPRKMQQQQPQGANGLPLPHQHNGNQNCVEGAKAAAPGGGGGGGSGSGWDSVWGN